MIFYRIRNRLKEVDCSLDFLFEVRKVHRLNKEPNTKKLVIVVKIFRSDLYKYRYLRFEV